MEVGRASLSDLSVYGWETASLSPNDLSALETEIASVLEWSEGVPVITCQRYEIIALNSRGSPASPYESPSTELRTGLRVSGRNYHGEDALLHITRVAAGLESLVLGEDEILGQVRSALATGSPELRRLTAPAIAAARALKREEGFDDHAGYALDRALDYANLVPEGRLTVVGGGPMGRRVAERASELGFEVTLVARRPLPLPPAIRFHPFGALSQLPVCDLLVTCLGRAAPQLGPDDLPRVDRAAVDLATPRNLTGDFDVPVIRLADLIEAQHASRDDAGQRSELSRRLETLLTSRLALSDSESPLGSLREEVERIRRQELLRSLRLHPDLPPEKLDTITRSLVNQIFHTPSLRLRQAEDAELAQAVAALFTDSPLLEEESQFPSPRKHALSDADGERG